jgi:DNA-binding response OmpR family regulator
MTSSPQTVLIVDDEPSVRTIAKTILSGAGYAIAEAADPEAARVAVQSTPRPFDLILLDLTLTGQSGASLIPEFRTRTPGSRVLLVSGAGGEEAEGLGADGFLAKPFTRAALLGAVQRVLSGT